MCNSKRDLRREDIKIGDKVTPVTPAGLCLSDKPYTDKYKQEYTTSCVLTGVGVVVGGRSIIIDYDSWPDMYVGIGKLRYDSCLVECKDGVGWAGAGALRKVEDNENIQNRFAQIKTRRCSSRGNKIRRKALE
jgi:hypothetical protein